MSGQPSSRFRKREDFKFEPEPEYCSDLAFPLQYHWSTNDTASLCVRTRPVCSTTIEDSVSHSRMRVAARTVRMLARKYTHAHSITQYSAFQRIHLCTCKPTRRLNAEKQQRETGRGRGQERAREKKEKGRIRRRERFPPSFSPSLLLFCPALTLPPSFSPYYPFAPLLGLSSCSCSLFLQLARIVLFSYAALVYLCVFSYSRCLLFRPRRNRSVCVRDTRDDGINIDWEHGRFLTESTSIGRSVFLRG